MEMQRLDEKSQESEEDDEVDHFRIELDDDRGSSNKMGDNKAHKKMFAIDNFLNSQPIPPKNKKGISVLREANLTKKSQKPRIIPEKPIL